MHAARLWLVLLYINTVSDIGLSYNNQNIFTNVLILPKRNIFTFLFE